MTSVSVNTYTHSVTYVAENILKSLKDILVLSGLDPVNLTGSASRESNLRAIRTWINSGHLKGVTLEIFDPSTNALVYSWELDVVYGWSGGGDGNFYVDTDLFRYHIKKTGRLPSQMKYSLIMRLKPGAPDVEGFGDVEFRSTTGMVKQSLGSAIDHNGLGATAAYWRRP